MDREGHVHDGIRIEWPGYDTFLIDGHRFTGKTMMAYGQTQITEDLYAAREKAAGQIVEEAEHVVLHDLKSGRPYVTYAKAGNSERALEYLRKALEEGFRDKNKLKEDPEFNAMRDLPEFQELLNLEPRVL